MSGTDNLRYGTTVLQVGPLVEDFLQQGMVIFFAEGAPAELLEFCALHRPDVVTGGLRAGDHLLIDDLRLEILAVGDVADANLTALGHISIKANGERTAPLPGDVCVHKQPLPPLREGTRVEILIGPDERERTS